MVSRRRVLAALASLAYWVAGGAATAEEGANAEPGPRIAGTVELAEGDSIVESKGAQPRLGRQGDPVYEADTITTFSGGELHLKMVDGAYLLVRENSKLTITSYVADGEDSDHSVIDLARGMLRAVTGWIGTYRRANYEIRTPIVTIGVRGTDHEPSHFLPGDPRGEPGTYDKVNEGQAFMRSKFGTVDIPANRAARFAAGGRAAPRLLASIPAFFRASRFERRFFERSRASMRDLAGLRAARREALRSIRGRRRAIERERILDRERPLERPLRPERPLRERALREGPLRERRGAGRRGE